LESEEKPLNKKSKLTLTAAAITLIVTALGISIYYLHGSIPQTSASLIPQGNPPQAQLKITGSISAEKILTIADLTQMPITNVTSNITGETATYVGVTITQLLNSTGASWDTGAVQVIASDGFGRTITTYQAYNSTMYVGKEFILAYAKDGQWITDSSEGPLKLITPGLADNYNIKCVAELNLQPWVLSVNGSVSHPLILTGGNITDYEVKTVNAVFAPGGDPQRTSDWTGVTLSSLLQASGVSSDAAKVTITAVDGYSKTFTVQQVQDTGMLIGYQENGEYLSPDGGQPFRLVIPTDEFKWGQYWVRWVSDITVS